jgi:hypothetical protein
LGPPLWQNPIAKAVGNESDANCIHIKVPLIYHFYVYSYLLKSLSPIILVFTLLFGGFVLFWIKWQYFIHRLSFGDANCIHIKVPLIYHFYVYSYLLKSLSPIILVFTILFGGFVLFWIKWQYFIHRVSFLSRSPWCVGINWFRLSYSFELWLCFCTFFSLIHARSVSDSCKISNIGIWKPILHSNTSQIWYENIFHHSFK